jgi:hypothetical protein
MRIITPGHRYRLDGFETPDKNTQVLQFIHKAPSEDDPEKFVTVSNGTTNEEVIRVLIDRLKFHGSKIASRENDNALMHLQKALDWLNERTANRENRGVLGTNKL